MRLFKSIAAGALLFIYSALAAHAQLAPFTPNGYAVAPLSSTTVSTPTVMPAGTQSVLVQNVGTDAVFCQPGPTATSSSLYIGAAGGNYIFPMGGNTAVSCIDQSTTSTVNFIPGSGYAVAISGGGSGTAISNPLPVSGTVTANLGTLNGAATAANQTTGNGSLATIATNTGNYNDPCAYSKKTFVEFSTATGTLTNIISAVTSDFVYICSVTLTTSAQTNFSLIASTTTACGGSPYAVIGSTTAASGLLLGPGVSTAGGIVLGNGGAEVAIAGTAASYVCTLFTTTNSPTVTGHVAYVQTAN